jgi:glycosyltransferase involved in cell wall biosynthesis
MPKFKGLQRGYAILIARLISSKGIGIAVDICRNTGTKLIIAGQGNLKDILDPKILTDDSIVTPIDCPTGITHIGYIEPFERSILLAGAKCLLCPTTYAEPFGGVNVEAQFSGVPVLSTDWGAFPETIIHGKTGFRCRTMDQFVWAINHVDLLDSNFIRERAHKKWSFEAIGPRFEEYFEMIQLLPKGGFYARNPDRKNLDWLAD